jgi:hypothetical protein
MTEAEWVNLMARRVRATSMFRRDGLELKTGFRLAYGFEISAHDHDGKPNTVRTSFETDFAIVEREKDGTWRPRVIVEAKITGVSTHDAITYSNKAAAHRSVYPYLRYGVMLGNRGNSPLPGRLYRHGSQFDFMISFRRFRPSNVEMEYFLRLLRREVQASRTMEKLLFESRKQSRDRFTILHRKLEVR